MFLYFDDDCANGMRKRNNHLFRQGHKYNKDGDFGLRQAISLLILL